MRYLPSPNQRALLSGYAPEKAVVGAALRVRRGQLTRDRVRHVFGELGRGIEALHTTFVDGQAVVRRQSADEFIFFHDDGDRDSVEDILQRPLDPGVRCFEVHSIEPDYVLLKFHHAVADGACIQILHREIGRLLNGLPISPETTPFSLVAADQNRLCSLPENGKPFQELLQVAILPDVRMGPYPANVDVRDGVTVTLDLSGGGQDSLEQLARRYRATPSVIMLAVLGITHAQYSGMTAFTPYMTFANRKRFPDSFGYLVNTMPVPLEMDGDMDSTISSVRNRVLLAHRCSGYPAHEWTRQAGGPIPYPRIPFLFDSPVFDYGTRSVACSDDVEIGWDDSFRSPMAALLEAHYRQSCATLSFRFACRAPATMDLLNEYAKHVRNILLAAPAHSGKARHAALEQSCATVSTPDCRELDISPAARVVMDGADLLCHEWLQADVGREDTPMQVIETDSVTEAIQHMLTCYTRRLPWCVIDPAWPDVRKHHARAEFERWRNHSDLAYVMFTSGTTGTPKTVAISRDALLNQLRALDSVLPSEWRNVALLANPTFDASLEQIFLPLIRGGTLHIPDRADVLDPVKGRTLMEQVDVFDGTPTLLRTFLDVDVFYPEAQGPTGFMIGGEVLQPALVRRLRACRPQARICNSYGPTETTINVLIGEVQDEPIPLGHPLPGYSVRITDVDGFSLPTGAVGELRVAGVGVALSEGDGEYCTGDHVSRDSEGRYFFHGRNDRQIKVHGIRIDPAEIEGALDDCPSVEHCHAFRSSDDELCLVVQAKEALDHDLELDLIAGIEEHLARRLPREMRPARIRLHRDIPMNSAGKADWSVLEAEGESTHPFLSLVKQTAKRQAAPQWGDRLADLADSLSGVQVLVAAADRGWVLRPEHLYNATLRELWQTRQSPPSRFSPDAINWTAPARPLCRVLLTGATGYLGIHLAKDLLDHTAAELVLHTRRPDPERVFADLWTAYFPDAELPAERVKMVSVPIEELSVPDDVDCVIHAAALTRFYADPQALDQINVQVPCRLWHQCRQGGRRFIHCSTLSVLVDEIATIPYVHSKRRAEEMLGTHPQLKVMRIGQLGPRAGDRQFRLHPEEDIGYQRDQLLSLEAPASIQSIPVDRAARAIVQLVEGSALGMCHIFDSRRENTADAKDAVDRILHQFQEHPVTIATIAELNRLGFDWHTAV